MDEKPQKNLVLKGYRISNKLYKDIHERKDEALKRQVDFYCRLFAMGDYGITDDEGRIANKRVKNLRQGQIIAFYGGSEIDDNITLVYDFKEHDDGYILAMTFDEFLQANR